MSDDSRIHDVERQQARHILFAIQSTDMKSNCVMLHRGIAQCQSKSCRVVS
jgi:hypothetical protein